nr:EOG090X0B8X [Scapholeberis mucronata]
MAEPFILVWVTLSCCLSVEGSQVEDVSVAHVYADVGSNVSLPCLPQSLRSNTEDYTPPVGDSTLLWVREGKTLQHSRVETNGILSLTKIAKTDAGLYTCQVEQSFGYSERTFTTNIAHVELHVKTTPPAPEYLTVYPSSVLALATWKLNSTGGYPIKSVSVVYQQVTDDWNDPAWHRTYPEELSPTITQLEIYKLSPNTTYRFRVWAANKLGPGDYAEVITTTKDVTNDLGKISESHLLMGNRFQSNPWILSFGVLVGSVGFTSLVLAFFLLQNRKICSRRRTYDSSDDMELVTNIILNPAYAENDRTLLTNESPNDRQALLKPNRHLAPRPAPRPVCL